MFKLGFKYASEIFMTQHSEHSSSVFIRNFEHAPSQHLLAQRQVIDFEQVNVSWVFASLSPT